jgi:segregation and condensation protein B
LRPNQDPFVLDFEARLARRQRVEAILLLAREPLNSRKLAAHARLTDGTEARTLVRELNELYDRSGRAMRVEEVAGGFRLLTRPQFAPWLRRLEHVPPQVRLSAPSSETLAVVAYRQPVLRAEIEAIRGVSCGEILRQLMDRDLVRIGGRSDELGRPYLYTTTKRFLQLFGLQSLDQLPRAEALRGTASAEAPADGLLTANVSPSDQQQEEEKLEVSATSQNPADVLDEVVSLTVEPPALIDDEDVSDADDFDDDEIDDDDFDDFDDDSGFDDEEDDFEDDEWEEVEGDDDETDEDWDDDDWDDDDYDDDDDDDDLPDDDDDDDDDDWD